MNSERHREKGRRLEQSQQKLDPSEDWEAIVEIIYNAAIQYIASYCEQHLGRHRDSHKGLAKFLDKNDLSSLAQCFRELDILRISRWYGGQGNGATVRLARAKLDHIKQQCEI